MPGSLNVKPLHTRSQVLLYHPVREGIASLNGVAPSKRFPHCFGCVVDRADQVRTKTRPNSSKSGSNPYGDSPYPLPLALYAHVLI